MRHVTGLIVFFVVLWAGNSAVSAQVLDGAWFKLSVSAKGYSVAGDESIGKAKFKAPAYMQLQWDAGDTEYDYFLFCQNSLGHWVPSGSGSFGLTVSTEDYIFLADHDWNISSQDASSVHFYFAALIRAKLDKTGALSSAMFATLGAEVDSGSTPACAMIYGGATVKGKTINAAKLPFPAP